MGNELDKYISQNNEGYYVYINRTSSDEDIARYLHLPFNEYEDILIKHGGCYHDDPRAGLGYYFETIESIRNTLLELETYMIFNKLTE